MIETVQWYLMTTKERAELVRFYLNERGWSYGELANHLGVTRNVIAGICNRNGIKTTNKTPKIAVPRSVPRTVAPRAAEAPTPLRAPAAPTVPGAPSKIVPFPVRKADQEREEAFDDMAKKIKAARGNGSNQSAVPMLIANKRDRTPNPGTSGPRPLQSAVWQPLPNSQPIVLEDTGSQHCRWPVSEDNKMCCGNAAKDGKPYCSVHYAMAYRPAPPITFGKRKKNEAYRYGA